MSYGDLPDPFSAPTNKNGKKQSEDETNGMCILGECMALCGKPNDPSIQYYVYIFMQYVDT